MKNNGWELEELRRELDLDGVPPVVEERLEQVLSELPDTLPTKRRSLRTAARAVAGTASVLAAAVLLLFGLNTVNPAFAESIPGIGSLFAAMNGSMHPMGSHVATYRGGVEELDLKAAAQVDSGYGLLVEEGFCDGTYLYLTLRLSCPEDAAKYDSVGLSCEGKSDFEFFIQGKRAEMASAGGEELGQDKALVFVLKLPEAAENGEQVDVSLRVKKLYGLYPNFKRERRFDEIDVGFSAEFSVTADTTKNSAEELAAEDNGVELYGVERTPGYLLADMEIPFWGREGDSLLGGGPAKGYVMLFAEDGEELHHNSNLTDFDFENAGDAERIRGTWAFDGPPEQSGKVILRVLDRAPELWKSTGQTEDKPVVFAEFTIDWKAGTAVPSETYLKEGLAKADTEEYRNTVWHPDFTGGYYVVDGGTTTDMWHNSQRMVSYVMMYSDAEYRPIELRFYRQGKLMGAVASHPEAEFNDEAFNEGTWPAYRDETGYYTAMPAQENTKGAAKELLMFACYYPEGQEMDREKGDPIQPGEGVDRIDLVDSETGEVLADLTKEMVYRPS